ncbi:MAG: non-ribosomal peptide synthetase, partial [Rubrivivax sp.]
ANFFELGGDSILSLQIVARARAQGWKISPRQLFEHQSVAELAAVAQRVEGLAGAGWAQEALGQALPLLPIQALFFEREMPRRDHWNQSVLLGCDGPLDASALRTALQAVIRHHDALRLRFKPDAQGAWTQTCTAWDASHEILWVRQVADEQALVACCEEAQRSLDLAEGPLLRAVLAGLADGTSRLLLTAHHLVVDGVSWRILLDDLRAAYDLACAGLPPTLPPRTTSYGEWSRRLQDHAAQGLLNAELAHWRSLAGTPADWPADHAHGSNVTGRAAQLRFELSAALTQQLLKEAPAAYRTQVNDLLLTAVGRALCAWRGTASLLIDLEGHGREDLFDEVDCSRTVGWFTSVFPVRVRPAGPLGQAIRRVKEDLQAVPGRGLGFGLLGRWGDSVSREALAALPRRDVVFNYLGQFDSRGTSADLGGEGGRAHWWPATESAGASSDPGTPFSHELAINGQVMDGVLSLS